MTTVQRLVDELILSPFAPPGAVVLVRDGNRLESAAAGFADVESARPMHIDERFRVGSVTKTFVATTVLQLVAERRLGLDDPVSELLDLPHEGVTIRCLLNHTSGLRDYLREFFDAFFDGEAISPHAALAVARDAPLEFVPGSSFGYSNTNYIALGLTVEHLVAAPLAAVLADTILEPLGLGDTALVDGDDDAGVHATGYGPTGEPSRAGGGWAAGALVSTARDLAGFFSALLGGGMLPAPLLREMTTTVDAPELGPWGVAGYGLGLLRYPVACGWAWGQDGLHPGYVTHVLSSRDGRHVAVAAANRYSPNAAEPLFAAVERGYCDG